MGTLLDVLNAVAVGCSFPSAIPLHPALHQHRSGKQFKEIRVMGDMPSQFLTGDLTSFNPKQNGWTAIYSDSTLNSKVVLNLINNMVTIEESIGDICTSRTVHSWDTNWVDLTPGLAENSPFAMIQALNSNLSHNFNIYLQPWNMQWPSVCFFPDGFFFDLYMPVPVSRLRDLFDLHHDLVNENCAPCSIKGEIKFHGSVVNYLENKNGPGFENAPDIDIRNIFSLGTPFWQSAQRETASAGSAAWTLRRSHYVYHASSSYRCLPYLLQKLKKKGLIGISPRWPWEESFPNAPEYEAWIIPAPLMQFGWDTLARTIGESRRRLTILPWKTDEVMASWKSPEHSLSLIASAELASQNYLNG